MIKEIRLLKHQLAFVEANERFVALVGGLGSGKSDGGVYRTILNYLKYGNIGNVGYWLPTYSLLHSIALPRIEQILKDLGLAYKKKNMPHIEIRVDSYKYSIILKSYEKPDGLIGFELLHLVIDELDTLKKQKAKIVFTKAVARTRLKMKESINTIGVVTTPDQGTNGFVYEFFVKQANDNKKLIKAKTKDNIYLPKEYEDNFKDLFTPEQVKAMLNGEFVNFASHKVYTYFNRSLLHSFQYNLYAIHIGLDFNIGGTVATLGVLNNKHIHIFRQMVAYDTADFISKIKANYAKSFITIYPDASGHQRSTNSSKTDIALLQQSGFTVVAKKSNIFVRDRVNAVNWAFSKGFISFEKNEELEDLFIALELQGYDDKGEPEKFNEHPSIDDRADSLGYLISYLYNPNIEIQQIRSNYVN